MKLNLKSMLIQLSNVITFNCCSSSNWVKSYFSLSGVRQNGRVHCCSKKCCELCRSVFEFVKIDMFKKLNVADIF